MLNMKLHVSIIARNEMGNHLDIALNSAFRLASGGVFVTDDASTDETAAYCESRGAIVRRLTKPEYWESESAARQRHLAWVGQHIDIGDWVLGLDADEVLNDCTDIRKALKHALAIGVEVILFPLYEIWNSDYDHFRIDGDWSSAFASRLYRWNGDFLMEDREMGGGSEPRWVKEKNQANENMLEENLHLLHFGYSNEESRKSKMESYKNRFGGHGHPSSHIMSICEEPTLKPYNFVIKDL